MKKSKLIKEYIEVKAFEVKEYLTRFGTIKVKRKKIEVIKNNVFKIKNYEDLIKTKSTFFNEILFVINEIYKAIKSPSILMTFLIVFLLFISVIKKTHNIDSKFDFINSDKLLENYEILMFNIDSLNNKMSKWKSLLDKNLILEKNKNNKSYWSALSIKDYSYNLRGGACFGGYSFNIEVKDNQVISITDNNDSNLTSDQFIDKYKFNPSINQIFNVFETILTDNPDYYSIEYDSVLKYPKNAFFDFKNCIKDEEGCWEISDFKHDEKSLKTKNYYYHEPIAIYNGC